MLTGRVVEVMRNVSGQIVAIPVKPNVPVKKSDVPFQIDPAPFHYKAAQCRPRSPFIVENEITPVGMFSQNGFQTVKAEWFSNH